MTDDKTGSNTLLCRLLRAGSNPAATTTSNHEGFKMKKITLHLIKQFVSGKSSSRSHNEQRLFKALKENYGTYTINKDGFVKIDLSNPLTQERIIEQINKCGNIKTKRA